MRSTFLGLNISSRGIYMAQRQLDVTGHNIANQNVDGYSRQRYTSSAVETGQIQSQVVATERGKVGSGVESLSLDQIRDVFLDRQFRGEQTKSSYWTTRSDALYYVEDIFNTIGETSLDALFSKFFNSIQELSKNPTDEAIRTNVLSQGKQLCEAFNMCDKQLKELMEQQNYSMLEEVKKTNAMIARLAGLNDNIHRFELGGSKANDLRDERELILDELSSMMDITYVETAYDPPVYNLYGVELSRLQVYAGGNAGELYEENLLVSHKEFFLLEVDTETGRNEIADSMDPPLEVSYIYLASGVELSPDNVEAYYGGKLQSYIDTRDGNLESERPGIPYFLQKLNILVETMVTEFNNVHNEGYTMPYDGVLGSSGSVSGIDFFNADGLSAGTIAISEDVLLSAFNIAASTEYVTVDSDGHLQTGNNENALALITRVREAQDLDDIGSVEGFYKNFLGEVASEVSASKNEQGRQDNLLYGIQTQRVAISGVDEDEEMSNLIRFQHAYTSSARCITTVDELLEKLINGTGRVGL